MLNSDIKYLIGNLIFIFPKLQDLTKMLSFGKCIEFVLDHDFLQESKELRKKSITY